MKSVIVLEEKLEPGIMANAAACIASGLFKGEEMIYGQEAEGDYFKYIPITKIPILITKRHTKSWKELLNRAKKNKLKYMVFTEEAQSTVDYQMYVQRVQGKSIESVHVIGIGVLGEDEIVKKFAGDLPLLH